MQSLVLYDSEFGNTKRIAEAVAGASGSRLCHVNDVALTQLNDVDLLIVGCPTQRMGITEPLRDLLTELPDHWLDGVRVAAFDTRFDFDHMEKKGALRVFSPLLKLRFAAKPIEVLLKAKGGEPITAPEGFIVLDTEGPLRAGELERAEKWGRRLCMLAELA